MTIEPSLKRIPSRTHPAATCTQWPTSTVTAPPIGNTGSHVWITNGPGGGIICNLTIQPGTPRTIYTAADQVVFRSTNSGDNWNGISADLPGNITLTDPAIDPMTPSILYAGTFFNRVYKSTNRERTLECGYDRLSDRGSGSRPGNQSQNLNHSLCGDVIYWSVYERKQRKELGRGHHRSTG
jgi:hypothetical protein